MRAAFGAFQPHTEIENKMSNRIFVGNLSFDTTTDSLRAAFSAYGEVTDAHIPTDRSTGQARGFGFVTMGSASEAQQAIENLNGSSLEGREIRVNEAEERSPRPGGGGGNQRRNRY